MAAVKITVDSFEKEVLNQKKVVTLIVFKNGEVVGSSVGLKSKSDILEILSK